MSTVIETCLSPGLFALTYDDGIGYCASRLKIQLSFRPYTAGLLDTLKEKGVKATFFILGVTLSTADPNHAYNRKILRRMAKEGHVIGSHTYNHQDLTGLTDEQIEWQMTETASLIRSATGVSPKLMRPPFGYTDWILDKVQSFQFIETTIIRSSGNLISWVTMW